MTDDPRDSHEAFNQWWATANLHGQEDFYIASEAWTKATEVVSSQGDRILEDICNTMAFQEGFDHGIHEFADLHPSLEAWWVPRRDARVARRDEEQRLADLDTMKATLRAEGYTVTKAPDQ